MNLGDLWYVTVFIERGLVAFPPATLVQNIGQDGSGTHGAGVFADFRGGTFSKPDIILILTKNIISDYL